ncbi:hypothetical protein PIROE2DRAFT_5775 [Piromyces sp. E2]|nr:hypothetical protein PIROE2DRAFT_5775 [Piromyces sp. E2]|eukprot:OUM66917.1 hypothetical protein PIROE2DRAFT_5775 [Piromyces sp. E2]
MMKEIRRLDKWIVGICCDIILWGSLFLAMGVATINEYFDIDLDLDQIKIDFGSKKLMLILTLILFIFTIMKCCIFATFCRYVHSNDINDEDEDEYNKDKLVSVEVVQN